MQEGCEVESWIYEEALSQFWRISWYISHSSRVVYKPISPMHLLLHSPCEQAEGGPQVPFDCVAVLYQPMISKCLMSQEACLQARPSALALLVRRCLANLPCSHRYQVSAAGCCLYLPRFRRACTAPWLWLRQSDPVHPPINLTSLPDILLHLQSRHVTDMGFAFPACSCCTASREDLRFQTVPGFSRRLTVRSVNSTSASYIP